ncbi:hypothetical protein [Streptomyces sp. enrichment culture]|uniref:hypothetical protein n=1 Tax=Streptomyces sp. enrichment culture TaxID=1795815 RepID=UPI003F56B720
MAQATRRTLTAAARAAAKRADRAQTRQSPQPADVPRPPRAPAPSGRTVVVEAPDGWDDPPEPRPRDEEPELPRPLPGRLRLALLGVVLVAGLTAVGVLGWQYREARATEQARVQALAAARAAAPVVLSYDHRRLDRDFARARALLTGKFREEYARTTKQVVGPTARKYEGVVRATVVRPADGGAPAASVVSASPDRAVVLLFVNQVTESTQVTGSRVDLNRVRMTVDRTPDGWKVSAVDAL